MTQEIRTIAAARALIEPLTGYTPGPWRSAEEVDPHCFDTRIEDLHGHELAFCDPEDARLIAAAPDLRDMVATLADEAQADAAEVVSLQDLNAALAGEAGKLWAENQRLRETLEAARLCLDFMAAGDDEAAKMAKLAINSMARAALRSTEAPQ